MSRGPSITYGPTTYSKCILSLAAFLFAIGLTSCANIPKPAAAGGLSPAQPNVASTQVGANQASPGRGTHIVLPNPSLVGCKAPSCYQVLPDASSDASAVYPWQVSLDFNQPAVIGLTALYDQPTLIADVKGAIDERYGKWAQPGFTSGPVLIWRVEPPTGFVIQLSTNSYGMVQLIYLMIGARHPTSDHAATQFLRTCEKQTESPHFACQLARNAIRP
jgi:hypothetical protein